MEFSLHVIGTMYYLSYYILVFSDSHLSYLNDDNFLFIIEQIMYGPYQLCLIFKFPGLAKIVFATYNNLEQWLQPPNDQPYKKSTSAYDGFEDSDNEIDKYEKDIEEKEIKILNSKIISASVNERKNEIVPLSDPVIYTLEHITVIFLISILIFNNKNYTILYVCTAYTPLYVFTEPY